MAAKGKLLGLIHPGEILYEEFMKPLDNRWTLYARLKSPQLIYVSSGARQ